jgi:hypothetical protein
MGRYLSWVQQAVEGRSDCTLAGAVMQATALSLSIKGEWTACNLRPVASYVNIVLLPFLAIVALAHARCLSACGASASLQQNLCFFSLVISDIAFV